MEKNELDLLEEYIAMDNKEARNNAQLGGLCDVIDEIRALNPPLPAHDFIEQTVERIAVQQSKRKLFGTWYKPAAWTSAAVAAVLLITMGVLPHKPTDTLPPVPAPPAQQAVQSPAESSSVFVEQSDITDNQAADTKPDLEKNKTEQHQIAENNKSETVTIQGDTKERKFSAKDSNKKNHQENNTGEAVVVQERMQAARALVAEPAAEFHGKVPFKVLTIPERSPVQVKINDNPPAVMMTYKAGTNEILVQQWRHDTAADAPKAAQASDQAVRLLHGDVIVEVSGNADRAVLEEFARSLE